jgi:hypothetical protein
MAGFAVPLTPYQRSRQTGALGRSPPAILERSVLELEKRSQEEVRATENCTTPNRLAGRLHASEPPVGAGLVPMVGIGENE